MTPGTAGVGTWVPDSGPASEPRQLLARWERRRGLSLLSPGQGSRHSPHGGMPVRMGRPGPPGLLAQERPAPGKCREKPLSG